MEARTVVSIHSRNRGATRGKVRLMAELSRRVVGQTHAIERIVPYVDTFRAGLSPEGRPAGIFLLLGPTGTGKTKTVEALAEVLHGTERNVLKINCGEFQMDHEVAKLIGAPPGYLGHRETHPMLSQAKLASVTSERSNLSIVLFDEIEKAAPSLTRILLGVLDKGTLKLGDNTGVMFASAKASPSSTKGKQSYLVTGTGLPEQVCAFAAAVETSDRLLVIENGRLLPAVGDKIGFEFGISTFQRGGGR